MNTLAKHIVILCGAMMIMTLIVIYPFLPGGYDAMAMPASTLMQALGGVGLLLVPVGVLWLIREIRTRTPNHYFGETSLVVGFVAMLFVGVVMFATVSISFAIIIMAVCLYIILTLKSRLKQWKVSASTINSTPLYLIVLPLGLTFLSVTLAKPLTDMSREKAIANSEELITAIEQYYAKNNRYPTSMQGVWGDYNPAVVGIERYSYALQGSAYSVCFEQPLFLFDRFGTQEFVMYNKLDEHVMPSHASWHLTRSPESMAANQGWYEARDAGIKHWKFFLFD